MFESRSADDRRQSVKFAYPACSACPVRYPVTHRSRDGDRRVRLGSGFVNFRGQHGTDSELGDRRMRCRGGRIAKPEHCRRVRQLRWFDRVRILWRIHRLRGLRWIVWRFVRWFLWRFGWWFGGLRQQRWIRQPRWLGRWLGRGLFRRFGRRRSCGAGPRIVGSNPC